jgi:hypothetical protein
MKPLLLWIGLEPWKRIIEDLVLECARGGYLSLLIVIRKQLLRISLTRRFPEIGFMNAFQKVGEFMNQERHRALAMDQDLIEGDGTKCHGLG